MTRRELEAALLQGLSKDSFDIALAPADLLAPYLNELEAIRDNLTRAYEKARKQQVTA